MNIIAGIKYNSIQKIIIVITSKRIRIQLSGLMPSDKIQKFRIDVKKLNLFL